MRRPYVPTPGTACARLIGVLVGMGQGVQIATGQLAMAADVPAKQVWGLLRHALDRGLVQKRGGKGCEGLVWSLTSSGRDRFATIVEAQAEMEAHAPDAAADLEPVQRTIPAAASAPLVVTPRAWWGGPLDLDAMKAAGMNSDECSVALLEAHLAREHAELDDGEGRRA